MSKWNGPELYILDARTGFGTLARVSITGNAPRELVENALQADWTPDGKSLAAVIASPERLRVECPLGTVVYELPQEARTVRALRVSPDGTRIGQVLLPEICSNVCFGGPKRNRLFMTASQSRYAV